MKRAPGRRAAAMKSSDPMLIGVHGCCGHSKASTLVSPCAERFSRTSSANVATRARCSALWSLASPEVSTKSTEPRHNRGEDLAPYHARLVMRPCFRKDDFRPDAGAEEHFISS